MADYKSYSSRKTKRSFVTQMTHMLRDEVNTNIDDFHRVEYWDMDGSASFLEKLLNYQELHPTRRLIIKALVCVSDGEDFNEANALHRLNRKRNIDDSNYFTDSFTVEDDKSVRERLKKLGYLI